MKSEEHGFIWTHRPQTLSHFGRFVSDRGCVILTFTGLNLLDVFIGRTASPTGALTEAARHKNQSPLSRGEGPHGGTTDSVWSSWRVTEVKTNRHRVQVQHPHCHKWLRTVLMTQRHVRRPNGKCRRAESSDLSADGNKLSVKQTKKQTNLNMYICIFKSCQHISYSVGLFGPVMRWQLPSE